MWNNGHDAYLEGRILSAGPVELIHLLYQGCVQLVRDARLHLAEGRISERSNAITRACEILVELNRSLDHSRGGEIAQRLRLLYDYMQSRLIQANMEQSEAPLIEVLGLLTTLGEAWDAIRPVPTTASAEKMWQGSVAERGYSAQSWNF